MPELVRLASLIFNQPHLITPEAADAILQALDGRIGEIGASRFAGTPVVNREGRWQGYNVTSRGAAIVPVIGELTNRGAYLGASSGLVSYEGLRQQLRNAASDPNVRGIVLDIDSPGGMASGMNETADLVRAIAQEKPVIAVANSLVASAAYGIASGATKIVATQSSQLGSIGVIYIHADRSQELAKRGIKVTIIHAGAHKADGNSFMPLPESVRADIQARVDKVYSAFIATVLAGRPQLTERQVRDTEARVYMGSDAVEAGLADEVGTFDGAVAEVEAGRVQPRQQAPSRVPASNPPPKVAARRSTMDIEKPAAAGGWESMTLAEIQEATKALRASLGIPETEASAAVVNVAQSIGDGSSAAATAADQIAALGQARTYEQGRADELARIKAILGHPEAKDRQVQAHVLALETDMSAEKAAEVLAKLPQEQREAESSGNPLASRTAFYQAVAKSGGNPRIAHQGEADTASPTPGLGAAMKNLLAKQPAPRVPGLLGR